MPFVTLLIGFAIAGVAYPERVARYYNLGNAHVLADEIPEAILAYRHGLRLDPNDQGLRENLDYARARVQYSFGDRGRPEEESWPAWLYRPPNSQVLTLAFLFYSAACIAACRWLMTGRRGLVAAILLAPAVACGLGWLHLESMSSWQERQPLVVIREDKLPLRKGNGLSYPSNPDLPVLARGMEARRLHQRGGWLQIQFAGGAVGWVQKTAVLVDQ